MRKVAFLDRDGVLNKMELGKYINLPKDLKVNFLSRFLIFLLHKKGYRVVVITNQAGIGTGYLTQENYDLICEKLINKTKLFNSTIDYIYTCPHKKDEGCGCRKPEIGLFAKEDRIIQVDKNKSFMVGDFLSDALAAYYFGIKSFNINRKEKFAYSTNFKSLFSFIIYVLIFIK